MKCKFLNCKKRLTPCEQVSGNCLYCRGKFCPRHRTLEDHNCPKKQEAVRKKSEVRLSKPKFVDYARDGNIGA